MNPRNLIVIVLALVCGLSAVFLVKALRNPVAGPTIERTPVVYAVEDIRLGELVVEKNLEIRQLPVEDVQEDAIRKIADAVGRVCQAQLDKGDMVRERKLAPRGASQGIAALIPSGMRPFGIQLPPNSTPIGNFKSKDRVDVVLMENTSLGNGPSPVQESGRLLLQDIEVFMVGMTFNPDTSSKASADDARLVTLLVTPEDARKLSWARTHGTLDVLLRNPNDHGREAVVEQEPTPEPMESQGLAEKIRPGMRAFTLDAPNFSAAIASYLVPDHRVDILLTSKTDEEYKELTGGGSTKTILEDIKILAVKFKDEAPRTSEAAIPANPIDPTKPLIATVADAESITLEVSPSQAQLLDLGQLMGKLHLSLRGLREDQGRKEGKAVNLPGTKLTGVKKEVNGPSPLPQLKTLLAGELCMVPPKQVVVVDEGPRILARMQVRTLRGTQVGADSWTVYESTDPVRPRPTKPAAPPSSGLAPRVWTSH